MQKKLFQKCLIIVAMMLVIGLPLMMVEGVIGERLRFHQQVVQSIADDSVREQRVIGPVLVLPYTEEVREGDAVRSVTRRKLVFPNELRIAGNINTERRYRGIHQVLIYSGGHSFAGDFTLPAQASLVRERADSQLTMGRPYIALSVSDVRGIRDIPVMQVAGKTRRFEQGALLPGYPAGMHVPLDTAEFKPGAAIAFGFSLYLAGTERQHFVPVGHNNLVSVQSNWPHPQFGGNFLPEARSVGDGGFKASWRVSAMASGAQQQLAAQESTGVSPAGAAARAQLDSFNIGFIEPVNIYAQADRATKYGLLFVALTFAAFFVFELIKRLPIHPVQYMLVGLALVMFFLLLVSLSEHLDFLVSYLSAAGACIALIGYYLSAVLRSRARAAGFGAGLVLLYTALYGLLISENSALVLGSLLLFAALGAVMAATRKLDWYEIGKMEPLET